MTRAQQEIAAAARAPYAAKIMEMCATERALRDALNACMSAISTRHYSTGINAHDYEALQLARAALAMPATNRE